MLRPECTGSTGSTVSFTSELCSRLLAFALPRLEPGNITCNCTSTPVAKATKRASDFCRLVLFVRVNAAAVAGNLQAAVGAGVAVTLKVSRERIRQQFKASRGHVLTAKEIAA